MKINLIDFILGKFKSLKNDIKLLEKNKANNIDLEQLRGYNISSYEFLIAEGYPLELATYKENVEDGANFNKRYINIDKDISKVTTNTDIVLSFIYEKDGEKKIYQKFEKYSTDKFINTVQLPFIEGNPSIQISLYKNKQYNKNFEQIDSNKCSVLLNYGKKEADIIDEIDEVCFRISIRDRNVLTKDNTQEYIPTADYHPATKKYVDDKVTVKILPVDYNKNCTTNVADLEPHSIYMSPNDADFLYLGYEKLDGSFSGLFLSGNPHGKFIYTGAKDDTKIEVMLEGICHTAYFKTDTVDSHTEKTVFYLTKNNTTEFTPSNDYEPATKKYVDDNILLEQLPILRIDETNKRIYVNCNNMGTYKKYFVPNKYANVYGFSFIYTNEDSSETEIALIGGAMTRDDFILCARNTDTLFILILGGTDKYKYTKSTKTLEKGLYGYLKIGNTQEYAPTENYHPATKKYVDDNRDYYFKVPTILYDDPNLPKGYVDISTLETGTNYRVNSSIVSGLFKVSLKALNDDGTWFTVDDGSNTIGWSSMLSTSICVELKSDTFIGINMSSINNYCKYLSITKENGKWKLMQTKLNSISPDNMYEYDVVNDYNPATKKYVDDKVSNLPQFSFNDAGELVVTINGVSKTFVPKG